MNINDLLRMARVELNNGVEANPNVFFHLGSMLQRIQGGKTPKLHSVYVFIEELWGNDADIKGVFFDKETAQLAAYEHIEKLIEKNYLAEDQLPYRESIEEIMDELNSDEGFESAFAKINEALGYNGNHVLQLEEVDIDFS